MNTRCYLVVHLNTAAKPPTVVGAGTYSSSANQITNVIGPGAFALDVTYADGDDYESAHNNLRDLCTKRPYSLVFGWAWKMLPEHEQ